MRNLANTVKQLRLNLRDGSMFNADKEQMQIQQANLGGYKHPCTLHDTIRDQLYFYLLRL